MRIARMVSAWILDGPLAPLAVIGATMMVGACMLAPVLACMAVFGA